MPRLRQHATVVALVALVWIAYTVVTAAQVYDLELATDPNVTFAMCLELLLPGAIGFWTPLTLAFIAIARRAPLSRGRWLSSGLVLCAAIAAAVLARAAFTWLTYAHAGEIYAPWAQPLPSTDVLVKQSFYYSHTKILLIVFVCYLYVHVEKTHQNRVRIAELETRLTRARLDALSAQLHPHFLFNAMNSIAELIHHDADAADRMLVALGGLLRYSLASPEHELSVREETDLVAQYLSIEKIRLGDRLEVRWSVEPEVQGALMPALMLQPLAENAIVHGISRRRAPGVLAITIGRAGDALSIQVRNDGPSAESPRRKDGSGIGLANTQDRLRCLYGEAWSLTFDTDDTGTSTVRIELPLRHTRAQHTGAVPLAARMLG
jgi:LytS/YehU family sensor histidine kinase